MKITTYCLAIVILLNSSLFVKSQDDVLVDNLHHMHRPVSAVCFLCWEKEKMVKFAMKLFNDVGSNLMLSWPPNLDRLGISPDNAHRIVFITDLSCAGIGSLLYVAESKLLFKPPFSWIIIHRSSNNDLENQNSTHYHHKGEISHSFVPDAMRNLNLLVDSDVKIISNFRKNDESWYSYSIYKNHVRDKWNYDIISKPPRAIRRKNLQGAPIKTCYVLTFNSSIQHLEDYKDSHIDTITKVNYILTRHAIDIINGTRVSSFQNSWGYKDDNGKWNGMMGELTNSRADIGGSPLFVTSDRVSAIDYIAMPTPTRSKFVFKQPKLSYISNVFLLPFCESIWVCTAALVVLMSMALMVAAKVEKNPVADTLKPNPSDVALMALGALCQQGSHVFLRGCNNVEICFVGRMLILFLFLFLMFLYTSYSANIVALLQSSSSRIRTLSDLLNSRLKFAVHDNVFNRHYFSTATDPIRKAIYEKKVAPPGVIPRFISLRDGIESIREGLFAFHMEIGVGYKIVEEIFYENEKCGLQEIQFLQVVDPWLAVQKNSSYKEMIKIGFRRIQESGIQSRENWKLYTKKPRCSGRNSNFVSVGIVDCMPAIKLLLFGFTVSAIILMVEILFNNWKKRIQLRKQDLNSDFDSSKTTSQKCF